MNGLYPPFERIALQNAVSVSSMLLTTEATINEIKEDTNIKIADINSKVDSTNEKAKGHRSKAEIATDYGETAVEKGTSLAETQDKRKSFWRKLSGSWNKSAEREAGKKAVEAGNNLLDQVETVKASEKEITKKTKKYNQ